LLDRDDESLEAISSLSEIDKKYLFEYLTSNQKVGNEIADNIPLNKEKILKIISINTIEKQTNKEKDLIIKKEQESKIKNVDSKEKLSKSTEKLFELTQKLKQDLNLDQNPNYKFWQESAQKELLASNPNLAKD
jgi:hypothetical protein